MLTGEDQSSIAAWEAFAQDKVSGVDHNHLSALEDGIQVAQADNRVHIVGMAALVLFELAADNTVFVVDSRTSADPVS